jgi:hypothetical protein
MSKRYILFGIIFLWLATVIFLVSKQFKNKPYDISYESPRLEKSERLRQFWAEGKDVRATKMVDLYDFSSGSVEVMINNDKMHYIDSTGRILDFDAGDYQFSEGLAKILIDRACGYVDTTGMIAIPPLYRGGSEFSGARARVLEFDGDVPDEQPQKLEEQKTDATDNPDAMLDFSEDSQGAEICDTTGLIIGVFEIDTTRKIISGSLRDLFSGGLLKVRIEGKWGYIDTTGKIVITPQFLGAGDFSEAGRAPILTAWDDTIRYIDKTGRIVSTWGLSAAAAENQVESEDRPIKPERNSMFYCVQALSSRRHLTRAQEQWKPFRAGSSEMQIRGDTRNTSRVGERQRSPQNFAYQARRRVSHCKAVRGQEF